MSTILEAQRELERRGGGPPPPAPKLPKRRWPVAAGIVAGIVAFALLFVWQAPAPPPAAEPRHPAASIEAPPAPPQPVPAPIAAPAPARLPPLNPPADEDPPWGRAHPRKESPEDRLQPPPPPPRVASSQRFASEASPPTRERLEEASVVLPGGGLVSLHSITCAADGESCSAELSVDGRAARVYRGEAWQGVEVQLILPDTVYISQGGTVLSLRAR